MRHYAVKMGFLSFCVIYLSALIACLCLYSNLERPADGETVSQVLTMINYCLLLIMCLAGLYFFSIATCYDLEIEVPSWTLALQSKIQPLVHYRFIAVSVLLATINQFYMCFRGACYPNRPMYILAISPLHLAVVWVALSCCLPPWFTVENLMQTARQDVSHSLPHNLIPVPSIPIEFIPQQPLPKQLIEPTYDVLRQLRNRELETHCAICLSIFNPEDSTMILSCGHFAHSACLKRWLVNNSNCHLCRQIVVQQVVMISN